MCIINFVNDAYCLLKLLQFYCKMYAYVDFSDQDNDCILTVLFANVGHYYF